jgi:hypothetical protein
MDFRDINLPKFIHALVNSRIESSTLSSQTSDTHLTTQLYTNLELKVSTMRTETAWIHFTVTTTSVAGLPVRLVGSCCGSCL